MRREKSEGQYEKDRAGRGAYVRAKRGSQNDLF